MTRRPAIRIIGIAGAALFSPGLSFMAAADDFVIRNEVRLVLLDVSVRNHEGNFVPGLSRSNFIVLENGQPQTISVFDSGDAPVTMGILVDESYSMGPKRDQVLNAANDLIGESNRADEVFILNFNDTVKPGLPDDVPFSSDIPQLRTALYREPARGKTALYDAVYAGLEQLDKGTRGRKTLVLISDGGDNASRHKRAEAIDLLQRSLATVFTIGLFEASSDDADSGIRVLSELAKISGGEALFPRNVVGISDACNRIAKEIRTRYTIGYVPRDATGASPIRHIRVKVSAPDQSGLTVLTRTSYRYDEPQTK